MTTFIQYLVFGIAGGAGYVLLSQGMVVTYVGSGVLNFSQAAVGTLGAFIYGELRVAQHWSFWPAFILAILAMGVLGVLIHVLIMRPLRHSSSVAQVIATLGIITAVEGLIEVLWGVNSLITAPFLPSGSLTVGGVSIGYGDLIVLGLACAATLALWLTYRYTRTGMALRASAYSRRSAELLGWSPDALAGLSWALGSMITTAGLIIVVSFSSIQASSTPLVIFPMLGAALLGRFTSFPLTFLGAMLIGVGQSLVAGYVHLIGAGDSVPMLIVIAVLLLRRKGVAIRPSERLPELGTGRIRWRVALPLVAALAVLIAAVFPVQVIDAITTSLAWGTVMLSVVVLLGFTGQLSFEQIAVAGIAALIAGRLTLAGVPFTAAFVLAVLASVPVGIVFAVPAIRTKGVNLAIATLGLAITSSALLFQNASIMGAVYGTNVQHTQSLFGLNLDPVQFPERYCLFALACFVVAGFLVANVRRSQAGQRLIAVRNNEDAASALGISVFGAKMYAFVIGATVAAVGGILLAFQSAVIDYTFYNPINSALAVAWTVIGGVGFVIGPIFAAPFPPGGIGTWFANQIWSEGTYALALIGGLFLVVILLQDPNGLASLNIAALRSSARRPMSKLAYLRPEVLILRGWSRLRARFVTPVVREATPLPPRAEAARVRPVSLEVSGLTVSYGGVRAVDDVSLTVRPGEVVGLIGPNGAGKTTVINAVTGFVTPLTGQIALNAELIGKWPVHKRVRSGLGRTFQSLELFENATVRENLQVASDRRALTSYFTEILAPRESPLSALAIAAVDEFALEAFLDVRVSELSYGVRRLVSVARSLAANPSVLLLDEPAAGLRGNETVELERAVRSIATEWGMAVLVVEHNMEFVMGACDRIVVLDFGHQIAAGAPAEIRAEPAVIAAYLGAPEDVPGAGLETSAASEPRLGD